jgi:C-terminal processing protease CtpA/Prc
MNFKSQSLKNLAFSSNVDCYISGYSMGISIIQGQSDNYVYVKDIIKNGPGDKAGIRVGDQIVSVDGVSLLNLPYEKSLEILQNTDNEVNLIVSQVFTRKTNIGQSEKISQPNSSQFLLTNLTITPSKSLPNLKNADDYQPPKVNLFLLFSS